MPMAIVAESEKADFDNLLKKWKESKPSVRTGQHRAEVFALDSSGNFDDIISTWREPKNSLISTLLMEANVLQNTLGTQRASFDDLISTWKGRPAHLNGIEEYNRNERKLRSKQSHASAVSATEECDFHVPLIDTKISKCLQDDDLKRNTNIPVKPRNSRTMYLYWIPKLFVLMHFCKTRWHRLLLLWKLIWNSRDIQQENSVSSIQNGGIRLTALTGILDSESPTHHRAICPALGERRRDRTSSFLPVMYHVTTSADSNAPYQLRELEADMILSKV
jgi:hypothetical protein